MTSGSVFVSVMSHLQQLRGVDIAVRRDDRLALAIVAPGLAVDLGLVVGRALHDVAHFLRQTCLDRVGVAMEVFYAVDSDAIRVLRKVDGDVLDSLVAARLLAQLAAKMLLVFLAQLLALLLLDLLFDKGFESLDLGFGERGDSVVAKISHNSPLSGGYE